MADFFEDHNNMDEDDDIITLYNEERDQDEDFYHLAKLDVDDRWFVVLKPVEKLPDIEDDEVLIYEVVEGAEGDVFAAIEDEELLAWHRALGAARGQLEALRRGELTWLHTRCRVLAFLRGEGERAVLAAVNAGDRPEAITLPWPARDWMTGGELPAGACELPPMTGLLLTPLKPEG